MKLRKYMLFMFLPLLHIVANAQIASGKDAPYSVYNVTRGVILYSQIYGKVVNPVRGIPVYNKDRFEVSDRRYYVKIKDKRSGEIYTLSNKKGLFSPKDIVNKQRFNLFSQFLKFQIKEIGFNIAPITTSQCVTHKGLISDSEKFPKDSLDEFVYDQVKKSISDSLYNKDVRVGKIYSDGSEEFYYSIQNNDSINYAFNIYTVGVDNDVYIHNDIMIKDSTQYKSDAVEYFFLKGKSKIDLTYFLMSAMTDDNRTCYVLLFDPTHFYEKMGDGTYKKLINWKNIAKELKYQGDTSFVIQIK